MNEKIEIISCKDDLVAFLTPPPPPPEGLQPLRQARVQAPGVKSHQC